MFKYTEPQKAWLTALESDDYTQTKGMLHSVDGSFCCLGVACDLAVKKGLGIWDPRSDGKQHFVSADNGEIATGDLVEEVREWLGLGSHLGSSNTCDRNHQLIHLNDAQDKTFKQIAKIIKINPENYFY